MPKRPQSRRILAAVTDPQNLKAAWERVRSKAARGGIDQVSVAEFREDAEAHLNEIRSEMIEERYIPQPLLSVQITKETKPDEKREITLATIRDKIAQEAVRAVIEPRLERIFLNCSYGYRPGRGPQRAIARVNHYLMHERKCWVAVADIDNFFGSLNHDHLLDRIRPIVEDEAVLRLITLWLKIGRVDGRGRWSDAQSGVSQGGVISPLLANLYLHPFDEFVTQKGYGLVRYADDFVTLCPDRAAAEAAHLQAVEFLETKLNLRLNPNPRPVTSIEQGFGFLGIFFHGNNKSIMEEKIEAARRRITYLVNVTDLDLLVGIREFNECVAGWRRYYGSLVGREELTKLEAIVGDGVRRLLRRAFHEAKLNTIEDGETGLASIELLIERNQKDRIHWIGERVREAFRLFKEQQNSSAKTAKSKSPTQTNKSIAVQTKGPLGVAAAVRKRRRSHERQMAQISELVLNTPGCFLGKTSQRVIVRGRDRKNMWEIPSFKLTGITIAARGIALSADVIDHCAEKEIPLLFLSPQGKVMAMLSAPESSSGTVGLLQMQAIHAGAPAFALAKRFVEGKLHNQISLIKYAGKYRKNVDSDFANICPEQLQSMEKLLAELDALKLGENYDHSRGQLFSIEGRAANHYWYLFGKLLDGKTDFTGRERKGAKDLVNSLLNYGYSVLYSRVYLALLRAGLHPQLSFLHSFQKSKPTLVFDLIEEFRAPVVDRTVLTLFSRREKVEVNSEGFLTEETRQRLITRIHERLSSIVSFRSQDLKLEEIILHQAQAIVRDLKGEKSYRPYLAKW